MVPCISTRLSNKSLIWFFNSGPQEQCTGVPVTLDHILKLGLPCKFISSKSPSRDPKLRKPPRKMRSALLDMSSLMVIAGWLFLASIIERARSLPTKRRRMRLRLRITSSVKYSGGTSAPETTVCTPLAIVATVSSSPRSGSIVTVGALVFHASLFLPNPLRETLNCESPHAKCGPPYWICLH